MAIGKPSGTMLTTSLKKPTTMTIAQNPHTNAGCQELFLPAPRLSYASFSTVIFPSVTFSRTRSPSAILPPSSSSLSVSSTVR